MKKVIGGCLLALSAGLSTSVYAGGSVALAYIPESNIEIDSDFGSGDVDGDGFSFQASFDITKSVFLYGDYFDREFEGNGESLDWKTGRLGVAFLIPNSPVWIGANLESIEIGFDGGSEDETGFGIRAGLRLPVGERFAFTGELGYSDIADATALDGALGFALTIQGGLGVFADARLTQYEPDDDPDNIEFNLTDYRVGVRYDF